MQVVLGNQLCEMQRRVAEVDVEQDRQRMHQDVAQQAVAQVLPAVSKVDAASVCRILKRAVETAGPQVE